MSTISTSGDLFAYGKSTSGMLRPDNVVFYHPLDDSTEYTNLSSWSGDASFVDGKISQAMTSSFSLGTFGPAYEFDAGSQQDIDIAALNSTKFIMVWDANRQSKIGIVSGSTIMYGPNYDFAPSPSSIHSPHVSTFNEDTFVIAYGHLNLEVGGDNGAVQIGTIDGVSGTTISYGPQFDFQPNSGAFGAFQDVATIDDTTFVVTYQDRSDGNFGKAIIGTRSGTDVTYGSGFIFSSGSATSMAVTRLSATKFAVCFVDAGNGGRFNVRIGTIDGYNITYGDWVEFIANGSQTDIAALSSTSFVTALRFGGGGTRGECRFGTVSGDVITAGDTAIFDPEGAGFVGLAAINSNNFIVSYKTGTAPNHSYVRMGTISDGIITLSDQVKFRAGLVTEDNVLAYLPGTDKFVVSFVSSAVGESKVHTMAGFSSLSGVNSVLYPSTSGNDRIVTCMWGQVPTDDTSYVTIERGYSINLTSTSISLGGTTAVWNDAGIAAAMSGLNIGLSHFLVLDFENTSGTTWNLKTSLDGANFIDQGTQSSGTQSLVTVDTDPQVITSGVPAASWVDEVVLWGGDKTSFAEFTNDELTKVYQLGRVFGEPMDQYGQHGVVVSGANDLVLFNSVLQITASENLFMGGVVGISGSSSLFMRGSGIIPINASSDLFIGGQSPVESSAYLFINGHGIVNTSVDLYIEGSIETTQSSNLYIMGYNTVVDSGNLFVEGYTIIESSGDFSVEGHLNQVVSGNLFLHGHNSVISSGDLFINGYNIISGSTSLFVYAPPPDLYHIRPFYVNGLELITVSGDLFTYGYNDITTSGDLFTTGHIDQSVSGDLFIRVPELSSASGDLFVCGHDVASGSSTLIIFAPPPDLYDVIPLYISGPEPISISGDLFVAVHQSFVGDIELSMPSIHDLTFDSTDLFIKVSGDVDVSARPLDWLLRSSDHYPQIIGTLDESASTVEIQVWDVTDGQNTLLSLASSGCYEIGNTGRWGWSTTHLPVIQRYTRHYFYLMTSNLGGTFDGQFILDIPEGAKWIYPSTQNEYLL